MYILRPNYRDQVRKMQLQVILKTELAPKLTAMASVAQSVLSVGLEIQGHGFNSKLEALELHFSQLVPDGC